MATTINLSTYDDEFLDLSGQGEAWTSGIVGERTTASLIEVKDGKVEYAEAPTASAPSIALSGHLLEGKESQNALTVAASATIYVRAISSSAKIAITPGTAA